MISSLIIFVSLSCGESTIKVGYENLPACVNSDYTEVEASDVESTLDFYYARPDWKIKFRGCKIFTNFGILYSEDKCSRIIPE